MRELIEGLSANEHPAERCTRQVYSSHFRHLRGPWSRAVDYDACGNRSLARLQSGDPSFILLNARHQRVLPNFRAMISRPCDESDHCAVGIDESIRRAETAAHDVVGS